jgi:hypothetical protein
VFKKGNRNTKSLAYTSLLRSILECISTCWDPCREGRINALDGVQKKLLNLQIIRRILTGTDTLTQRRTIARLCAIFKAYFGERAWTAIRDRLRRAYCLSGVGHVRKIRDRERRADTGKYSFVNGTIENWNQLPVGALVSFPCKSKIFRELGKQL